MATDFPNSPANGATHTFGGTTYTYNSSVGAWTAGSSAGGASVTVSETAPSSPAEGDLWFDPSVLKTFVYYNDGLQINGYKVILQVVEAEAVLEHL